jgi:hypothetical protein
MQLDKKQLKKRGWTDMLINKLLKSPDAYVDGIDLYELSRVESKENESVFVKKRQSVIKRKETTSEAVSAKQQQAADNVDNIIVSVENIPHNTLLHNAIRLHNREQQYNLRAKIYIDENSDIDVLKYAQFSYVRARLTKYDTNVYNESLSNVVIKQLIDAKIKSKIYETYPHIN